MSKLLSNKNLTIKKNQIPDPQPKKSAYKSGDK